MVLNRGAPFFFFFFFFVSCFVLLRKFKKNKHIISLCYQSMARPVHTRSVCWNNALFSRHRVNAPLVFLKDSEMC